MMSQESIAGLASLNQKVITGIKRNAKLEKDYLGKIDREGIYQPLYSVKLKNITVFVKSSPHGSGNLLAIYNPQAEFVKRMHAIEKLDKYNPEKARYLGFSLIYHDK